MEKIYNFAKKDFFIFASTYVAIIFLVLLCFFPVCRAFERSEQNQAIAEIRDYASSMLGELDLQEQAIFNATRNLYSDRDFTSIYYNSTRSSSSSLFYDMTLLQKRIKLYYQNLEYVQDVLVYLPRDEKSRTFSSNSKRSHILRTSSRSRRLILSSIVSFAVWLKCTRTI